MAVVRNISCACEQRVSPLGALSLTALLKDPTMSNYCPARPFAV